jgi:hypothetical protein
MRALARVTALIITLAAAAAALAACGEQVFRPPNTAVMSPTQQHDATEATPSSGTLRQCPPSAINC